MIGSLKYKKIFNCIFKNPGFTIIELLVTLPIISILSLLVFTTLSLNINNIKKIDAEIELQQQAQFIFDFFESKIIESTGVSFLQDKRGMQKHNTNEKVYITRIIFKNHPNHVDKGYIFMLIRDGENNHYNLKYGIGLFGGASDELGNYIEYIAVEPLPGDKKYTEASGIKIEISFNLEGHTLTLDNSYYFRNSNRRI